MAGVGLAIYILMFPLIAAVVLTIIWIATYRELRQSRAEQEDLV